MLHRQAAPLREQAVAQLRQLVVQGTFQPGERLKERALVEQLQVSRTVIREALRQLEAERLIRTEPQIGPMVAELTADQARQLYEVRAALESTAARLAARNRTEAQLAELRNCLDIIRDNLQPLEDLLDAKQRFYSSLFRASRNTIIGEQFDLIQARISQLRKVTLSSESRGDQMVLEISRMVQAIADRDEELAYSATIEHVMAAATIAINYLSKKGA